MVNIPIKVLTNFSEWFTWMELKEALTKAKETLDLVHLARDRLVKLCFWSVLECFMFFFFFFAFRVFVGCLMLPIHCFDYL